MEKEYHTTVSHIRLLLVLLLSFSIVGCSDDEEIEYGAGNTASPTWNLEENNPNMPSGGTIVSQYTDSPAGSEIGKLVDSDDNTMYVTYHSKFYVTWNGNEKVIVRTYTLTSAIDSPEKDPKSWILSGSLDNETWRTIDTQTNQTFSDRKQKKTYEIDNREAFSYYRLTVRGNNGSSVTQIAEWTLIASDFNEDISDLMVYAEGYTKSSKTPMGTTHENDRAASAEQLDWLKDVSKQPDPFGGLSWAYFQIGSLYPFGDPKPADVNQHAIGDCSACAVLSAMAHVYPRYIRSMIRENDNQTFAVTLFDPQGKPVEIGVDNYFIGDGTYVNAVSGKNNQVTWATVLEKAMMKWKQVYGGNSDIGGVSSEYTAPIFLGSGESFCFTSGKLSPRDMQRAVYVSLQQGNILIGGFDDGDLPVDNTYRTVNMHAYSLHTTANVSAMFTMRNPWGCLPLLSTGGYSNGKEDGLLPIKENDGKIPSNIGFRVMKPGAAKDYCAELGKLEPYTPPVYSPAPSYLEDIGVKN